MAPRIYRSPLPDKPIVQRSIFRHQFPKASKYPSEFPAYIDAQTGATLNRGHIKDLALSFAYGLRNEKHAKRGDTIMMFSPNSICWPVVVFGAVAAGLRCTFANTAYTANELAYQYKDSQAFLICTTRGNLATVQQMLSSTTVGVASKRNAERRIILLPDDFDWVPGAKKTDGQKLISGLVTLEDLLKLGKLEQEEQFEGIQAEQETVFLCYSSGTTGKPKGVETTHQNLTTVLDIVVSGFPALSPTEDRMLAVLPFYHIYGLVKLLLFPFLCGVSTIVMAHFDPVKFCAAIPRYKVTIALIVPPVLVVMARHDCVQQYDMSSLRVMFSGAAPLGGELVKAVRSRLRPTNQPPLHIVQGYGLTETSPTTHLLPLLPSPEWSNITEESKYGSIGFLLPNLEARLVVDDKDGHAQTDDEVIDALEGQRGELWIRGRSIMKGYLNNPVANTNAFYPHSPSPPSNPTPGSRWFKTGDIGVVDKDGFFWIVDRKKELIKYKGFQVPPAELESVLLTHPKVADAGVIGVESARESTELPRAYIVPADPSILSSEKAVEIGREVHEWVKTKVAKHKYLRGGVIVVHAIPKSPAGKILRRHLKEQALKELAGKDPAEAMDAEKIRAKL
ncbi:AMP binding protein [Lentinula aciculospora]|uniref:AMP binding protein n=1 Tax=Lentinula aciculospora TaxID=153920 RepID=A0A9W9DSU9_9AGAR|nr:AMP binding protein [Lentinula aciculospora]KAJ4483621.1 AMP binding protein [Lentinula aciculospora]